MKSKNSFDPALCMSALRADLAKVDRTDVLKSYAADALERSLLKKYVPPSSSVELADKAVELFKHANSACSKPHTVSSERLSILRLWTSGDFADFPDSWDAIFSMNPLRCGPGASLRTQGRNSAYEKNFVNCHTTTSIPLAQSLFRVMSQDPTLRRTIEWKVLNGQGELKVESSSRLTTVPKNCDIDRTINVEASVNMCAQLLLGDIINEVLAGYKYDSAVQQERNKSMAQWGSVSGHYATIDLKMASDLIQRLLCKDLLPGLVFAALDDCRSHSVEDSSGEVIPLFMMSSMGNGFTFPLQTYVFTLALRLALYELGFLELLEKPNFEKMRYGVYGDDIICPTIVFDHLCDILRCFGLTVNTTKSFAWGDFRESCGGDFYRGKNVRGVYLKDMSKLSHFYSAVNRLLVWSARHNISIHHTIDYLMPDRWMYDCVPPDESDDAGIKVPLTGPKAYFAWEPAIRKLDIPEELWNAYGALTCSLTGLMDDLKIVRRDDDVHYRRIHKYTPEWAYSHAGDLSTLVGNERLCHRFKSQYSSGFYAVGYLKDLFHGVAYSDWSETVRAHVSMGLIRVKRISKSNLVPS